MLPDRILDAAGELFAARGVAAVEMTDIARAAGCSRATLYRYFDGRLALHTAFVHREARRVGDQVARRCAGIGDPHARLSAALTEALRLVRESPSLAAWFAGTLAGTEAAESSEVVRAMAGTFLSSLGTRDSAGIDRRARWLVRILTSLLVAPGRDTNDERAMLEEFVIPVLVRSHAESGR